MSDVIIALVFGLLALVASHLTRNAGQPRNDMKTSWAVIERKAEPEKDVIYYVKVEVDGKMVEGKSVTYRYTEKHLHVGDRVPVNYYMTEKGWVRVIFRDPDMSDGSEQARKVPTRLRWAAIGFFVLAALLLVF